MTSYDEEMERELLKIMRRIDEDAARRKAPYIERLARIYDRRMPRVKLTDNQVAQWLEASPNTSPGTESENENDC